MRAENERRQAGGTAEAMTSSARAQARCRPMAATSSSVNAFATVRPVTTPGPSRAIPTYSKTALPVPHVPTVLQWRNASWSRMTSLMSLVNLGIAGDDDGVEFDGATGQQGSVDRQAVGAPPSVPPMGAMTSSRDSDSTAHDGASQCGEVALFVGNDPDFATLDWAGQVSDLGQGWRHIHMLRGRALGGSQAESDCHAAGEVRIEISQYGQCAPFIFLLRRPRRARR